MKPQKPENEEMICEECELPLWFCDVVSSAVPRRVDNAKERSDAIEQYRDKFRQAIAQAVAEERKRIVEEIEACFLERPIGDKHFDIRDDLLHIINDHE